MSKRVLVVSARMGAGHHGAANEIISRMEQRGWETRLVDFLDASPFAGRFLERTYHFQIESAPWSYDLIYWLWSRVKFLAPVATFFLGILFEKRLKRWAKEFDSDLVITTYPFASVVLGRARSRRLRTLKIPVVTYLTDFAVHPLWVHKGVDAHLCVADVSSEQVETLLGKKADVIGPVVASNFQRSNDPDPIRESLGLPSDKLIVLVVAGSWGVGSLEQTVEELSEIEDVHPVVVCGRNTDLAERLQRNGVGTIFGWTTRMPELMSASDVVIQNAGGLSAMEAFQSGVPVVSYRPIAGHGRYNIFHMERAGVTIWAKSKEELSNAIKSAATGHELLARRATNLFTDRLIPVVEDVMIRASRQHYGLFRKSDLVNIPRKLASLGAATLAAFFAFNLAANALSSDGLNVDKASQVGKFAYVVLKPGLSNISDPQLLKYLLQTETAVVVPGQLALANPSAVRQIARDGIDVLNGGWESNSALHLFMPSNAVATTEHTLDTITGLSVSIYVPQEQVNSVDLAWISLHHQTLVHALFINKIQSNFKFKSGSVYEINGTGMTPAEVIGRLKLLQSGLSRQGFIQAAASTIN